MKTGPFEDRRPFFSVLVTGHPDAIPYSGDMHRPDPEGIVERAGAWFLASYLDGCLRGRRATHRLHVFTRAECTGIDLVARAYCALRGIVCSPESPDPFDYGSEAPFRRDLWTVARAHAVVWVGPRQVRDPVTLAMIFGIPYRVVPVPFVCAEGV